MGADASVVKRTQLHESSVHNKTPVQYAAYMTMGSILHLVCGFLFALVMFVLTKCAWGIKLLEDVSVDLCKDKVLANFKCHCHLIFTLNIYFDVSNSVEIYFSVKMKKGTAVVVSQLYKSLPTN